MDSIDAAELALSLPEVDPSRPSVARIYDFWLGGSQNFEADREAGRRAAEAMPTLPTWARANRVFLRHVVGELVGTYGIRQFLDLGSGVPTAGNVHEIAQAADPGATVVYIDMDPVAIAHARALLADNPTVHAGLADLREPRVVLEHPVVRDAIDWSKPVAVLMFAVLHFIAEDDEAGRIVRAFIEPCVPGSYLAISHGGYDHADLAAQQTAARDYRKVTGVPFTPRAAEQVAPWLDGLEIMPPGLVNVDVWLPSLRVGGNPAPPSLGVLARKSAIAGS
jgi:hypothetical protein